MSILEQFKKQLVQDLAQCMTEEREPRDQMWNRLNKEYGCDCNLLWRRISTMTIKKLAKLLAVEDRTESITSIARMTPTDWLVFDKILVYENIDVIGQESILSGKPESKVLWELFILVSSYHIETLPPTDLVRGWSNLTKTYNTRYSDLLTQPLTPWNDLIKKKLVIQANDFESYSSQMDQSETVDDDDTDLIEIKPFIETIDLNTDSDSDDLELRNKNSTKVSNTEDGETHIKGIDVAISQLKSEKTDVIEQDLFNYQENEETCDSNLFFPKIVSVEGNVNIPRTQLLNNKTQQYQDLNPKIFKIMLNDVDRKSIVNIPLNKSSGGLHAFNKTIKEEIDESRDCRDKNVNILEKLPRGFKFINDTFDLKCNDIETVYQNDQVLTEEGNESNFVKNENSCVEENDSTRIIDPKLLMFPICYTKKLDHMGVFKNINYLTVKGTRFIECVEAESRPIIMKAVKKEDLNKAVGIDDSKKCEVHQIKHTRRIFQNPKKRTYSLMQLHKNPDFNAQLYRLPVTFFLNERNKQLFDACKPVTIDLDRVFETNLVNDNLNLENTISPIIEPEKKIHECQNTVSIMPSTEDSLLDKGIIKLKEFLPQQKQRDISETSLDSSVHATSCKRHNKNFLTIEVSPLYIKSTDSSTKPPVKLVQFPSDTFHGNSTISPTEKSDDENGISVISSINESLVEESTVEVKELLTQQNEIDMPETFLNNNFTDKNSETLNENMLAIEISPLYVIDAVSKTNPPVKIVQCPRDTFNKTSNLKERKLDSKLEDVPKSGPKTNFTATSKIYSTSSKQNLCVSQQEDEVLITKKIVNKILKLLNDESFDKTKTDGTKFTIEVQKKTNINTSETNIESVEKTVNLGHCDDSKKNSTDFHKKENKTLNEEVTQRSISVENKSFSRAQCEIHHLQDKTKLRHLCSKLCKCGTQHFMENEKNITNHTFPQYDPKHDRFICDAVLTFINNQNNEVIENSDNGPPLPYQNPATDPQYSSIITETDQSFLSRRMSNNAEYGVSNISSSTRKDQGKQYNEDNKTAPARSNPLLITRVSSEPTRLNVLRDAIRPNLALNIPSNVDLSNTFECEKVDSLSIPNNSVNIVIPREVDAFTAKTKPNFSTNKEQNIDNINDQLGFVGVLRELNANADLNSNTQKISSGLVTTSMSPVEGNILVEDSIQSASPLLVTPSTSDTEIVARIEVCNGNIQIIPHNKIIKEIESIENLRKDLTDDCNISQMQRKANILFELHNVPNSQKLSNNVCQFDSSGYEPLAKKSKVVGDNK